MLTTLTATLLLALPAEEARTDSAVDLFSQLDRDQDGRVSGGEITAAQRPYFERAVRVADANRDGVLTRQELRGALRDPEPRKGGGATRRRFQRGGLDPARLDRNNDGQISMDEVPGPARERFRQALEQSGRDTLPVAAMSRMMSPDRRPNLPELFKRLDRNQDGGISREEALPGLRSRFDRLDRNKDGRITLDEMSGR